VGQVPRVIRVLISATGLAWVEQTKLGEKASGSVSAELVYMRYTFCSREVSSEELREIASRQRHIATAIAVRYNLCPILPRQPSVVSETAEALIHRPEICHKIFEESRRIPARKQI
jgi:hypothetical protein